MAGNSKLHVGIFGPGLSGKTTLAKALCAGYGRAGIPSLALDPHKENWGNSCAVFGLEEEEKFWKTVWLNKSHAIFAEEASDTISRDKTLIPAFTRLRHNGHKLHVVGHDASSLLPVMRRQFTTLYLFRQDKKSAQIWGEHFCDERILEAVKLNQYEFLHCEMWGEWKSRCVKKCLTL